MKTHATSDASPRRWKARRRVTGGVLACLMLGLLPSCYGRFPVTKAIYRWNGRITDITLVHSIIMIVFVIIPVYPLAMLLDAIIINTVEYWTGDNVVITQIHEQPDGTRVVFGPGALENEAILTIYRQDEVLAQRMFSRDEAGITTVRNESGEVISHVKPDGKRGLLFTDASDQPTGGLTAEQIASLRANATTDVLMRSSVLPPVAQE